MHTLYILDGDTDLRKRGERLLLRREGRVVGDVPLAHVDNVIVFGNVSLSAMAGLDRAATLDALRGVEGHATRLYFSGFRQRVRSSGFQFERRTRRPPRDPVNALLSFGYALLQAQIDGFVQAVGLDPYVGYLHEVRHGKPSLVLDLMEEFRPVFVDGLVLTLLNRKQLQPNHFKKRMDGVEIIDEGRRIFLEAFEDRLRTEFTHPFLKERVAWRRCFEIQVRILARALLGQTPAYVPFVQR